MAASNDNISMALYCDFENVALGVRDANYDRFDIKPVLEKLLLKGSIVVKKAYCDWERYKEFKGKMHEASFELIEIPHVRVSGKNSADIRMVVDALDLCYTKAHVNTFVIISGDSDFSPLVSKLRENAKYVIGVGVKNSTSDLLVANCDEFIFIDDLVRESRRNAASREKRQAPAPRRQNDVVGEERKPKEDLETRKAKAIDIVAETFDALMAERGDGGKIWASALKQAIKRRRPDFNEVYFGFRTFGNLLEEAQSRGLLDIGRDDKSGAFVYRSTRLQASDDLAVPASVETALLTSTPATPEGEAGQPEGSAEAAQDEGGNAQQERSEQNQGRRNGRFPRNGRNSRNNASSSHGPANAEGEDADATPVFEPVAEQAIAQNAAVEDDYDPLQAELDAADAAALVASGMVASTGKNRQQAGGRNANAKQGGRQGKAQGGKNNGRPDPRRAPAQDRFASATRPAPSGRQGQGGRKQAAMRNEMPIREPYENTVPASMFLDLKPAPAAPAPTPAPVSQNPAAPVAAPAPVAPVIRSASVAPDAPPQSAPVNEGSGNAAGSAPAEQPAAHKRRTRSTAKKAASAEAETESVTPPAPTDEPAKPARKPRRPAAKKAVESES